MLRQLIPNSDQKRDKASFLLEVYMNNVTFNIFSNIYWFIILLISNLFKTTQVIEYIHFLQEKVNKHEVVPYQGKLMNWVKYPIFLNITLSISWFLSLKFSNRLWLIPLKPIWQRNHQQLGEGTVPVLEDAQAVDMDQQCLNRAIETTPFPVLDQRNAFFSPASQLCPVSSDAALESEKLSEEEEEEEELSFNKGTISISSVYSQGWVFILS